MPIGYGNFTPGGGQAFKQSFSCGLRRPKSLMREHIFTYLLNLLQVINNYSLIPCKTVFRPQFLDSSPPIMPTVLSAHPAYSPTTGSTNPMPDKIALARCYIKYGSTSRFVRTSLVSHEGVCLCLRLWRGRDLDCTLSGDKRPNPPRTFSLFHPDN